MSSQFRVANISITMLRYGLAAPAALTTAKAVSCHCGPQYRAATAACCAATAPRCCRAENQSCFDRQARQRRPRSDVRLLCAGAMGT